MKPINMLCGQHRDGFDVERDGMCRASYNCAFK
jgi:hypothetical protein